MTSSERTRLWEEEKLAKKWVHVRVWLPPEAVRELDRQADPAQGGRGAVIARLLEGSG